MKETLGCDLFSRVGACGRRSAESADPGGVGVLGPLEGMVEGVLSKENSTGGGS